MRALLSKASPPHPPQISLPATTLLRTADAARISYPNQLLITMPLHNLSSKSASTTTLLFLPAVSVPANQIAFTCFALARARSVRLA